jgi:HD-GYP domain-containing protein (c-di-GMP phosphodiesterase class II)
MALLEVMSAAEPEDPLFFHNYNVCVLSVLVGKEMGLSEEDLHWLGVGALCHDVGFKNIPRDLHLTAGGFASAGADYKLHVEQGVKAAQQFQDFPKESLAVISQHHERLDGTGYPLGLQGDDISLFAKIVMVVDEYDDLCNSSERGKNMTPNKALSYLYKNETVKRKGEFSQEVIIALIRALGVYPPGTFVELNNGSIGVVVGVDPQIRAKPQVMTYTPELPKDEVTIIDMAEDEDVSIQRCLRPEELSKKIRQALSPQRVTGHTLSTIEDASLPLARR